MFSYEYCKIFKNTYFEEHLRMAASELSQFIKKGLKEKQVTKSRHIVNYMKEFKMYKLYGIFLLRDVTVFYLNMHIYFIFTVSEFFIGNIDGELSHISK